ncbi:hypothetical protein ADK59_34395 [Streptomyces sp. XY332]|nr:hypothetical protein ADK59_34395 [Streptomyces sp. XY332]
MRAWALSMSNWLSAADRACVLGAVSRAGTDVEHDRTDWIPRHRAVRPRTSGARDLVAVSRDAGLVVEVGRCAGHWPARSLGAVTHAARHHCRPPVAVAPHAGV